MTVKTNMHWRDKGGEKATTALYWADGAAADEHGEDAAQHLANISEATLYRVSHVAQHQITSPGTPVSGPYSNGRQALVLEFRSTASRRKIKVRIPAPDDVFGPDDEMITFDPATDTGTAIPDAIETYVLALEDHIRDSHGNPVKFVRAYRGKLAKRKRV